MRAKDFLRKITESVSQLNVGDPVEITGPVEHRGETGEIAAIGQGGAFVVVNLYNHGKQSFQASDVSYNDYADSDEEEAETYDRDPDARKWSLDESIGDGDDANAVVAEVIKLIGEGHTEVSPDVITTKVSAALGRPFMLKDLVACNNSSPELQHYIDSINPSKIKFSTDILTVKNEDPMKAKEQAQSGVASMAAKAANRPRLGEGWESGPEDGATQERDPDAEYDAARQEKADQAGKAEYTYYVYDGATKKAVSGEFKSREAAIAARAQMPDSQHMSIQSVMRKVSEGLETPLLDKEDYAAKKKALQDIQLDPHTHKDPELSTELLRRLAGLEQQRKDLK